MGTKDVIRKGSRVRMSEDFKLLLRKDCSKAEHKGPMFEDECWGCSGAHVDEFGQCVGIVEDKVENMGDVVNVRWLPSRLRYMYEPSSLVLVDS